MQEVQPSETETRIKVINDEIVAAIDGGVLILNDVLETVKRFNYKIGCASCIDGNEEYIVTGHYGYDDDIGRVCFYTRNSNDKPTVSKLTQRPTFTTCTGLRTR